MGQTVPVQTMDPGRDCSEKAPATPNPAAALAGDRPRFLAFVQRHVGSREAAEDILQDAYARGTAQAPAAADEAGLTAWFYRVLRNAIIDRHRRDASAHRALTTLATEMLDVHAPEPKAERVCGCVGPALATLKPEYHD